MIYGLVFQESLDVEKGSGLTNTNYYAMGVKFLDSHFLLTSGNPPRIVTGTGHE
jgi:hypothetical protein